ncbi:MAG: hypothetical protein KAU03_01695 [Candidatus Altiarchaeales archaeon]|nr:hypothetical protein [Candidatus Altiarchaeales archaeon]
MWRRRHAGTPMSPAVKGIGVRRVTSASAENVSRAETRVNPAVRAKIDVWRDIYAVLMVSAVNAGDIMIHAVKTTPVVRVMCAVLMVSAIPAAMVINPVVKETNAMKATSVDQMKNATTAGDIIRCLAKGINAMSGITMMSLTESVIRAEAIINPAVSRINAGDGINVLAENALIPLKQIKQQVFLFAMKQIIVRIGVIGMLRIGKEMVQYARK